MDFKAVIALLLKRFGDDGVRYGLMGGFALGLWGVPRSTVDLDFLVAREDRGKVDRIMRDLGYESGFSSENVSQYRSPVRVLGEVDFLHAFRRTSIEMLGRAVEKDVFGGEMRIRLLLPEDIIGLKMQAIRNNPARREQDQADIVALAAAQAGRLDWEQVGRYAELLDAQDLLKDIRKGAGS